MVLEAAAGTNCPVLFCPITSMLYDRKDSYRMMVFTFYHQRGMEPGYSISSSYLIEILKALIYQQVAWLGRRDQYLEQSSSVH